MKLGMLITRVDADGTVAAARECEAHGLDSLWLAEDLWHRGAMPLATACGLATERLRVGIGVVNPFSQHPSLMAMNYGALAELTGGRAVLGVGASVERWVQQMGFEYKLPRTAVKESVEIVRALLAGETSSYPGRAFRLDELGLGFACDQPTPIYVGAMGERTVRTAGAVGDGWIVSILEPIGYVRTAMGWLREGAEQAGRDAGAIEVVQYFPFACDDDPATARALAKELVAAFIIGELELYRDQAPVMKALASHLDTVSADEYAQVIDRLMAGAPAADAITDALVDELAIAGTPEQCAAQLRRYEQAGVTEAVLLPSGPVAETAAVLGERIRPLTTTEGAAP